MPKVTMIGLRPSAANFEKWPELTEEKLVTVLREVVQEMDEEGYDANWCLLAPGPNAIEQAIKTLLAEKPDVVLVGAGIRLDPDHFGLFEKLVNVIHSYAPQAYLCFNSNPMDTVTAVKRWV